MSNNLTPINKLNEYIELHKLRKSYEREELLKYIHTIDGHFTALSLYRDTYEKFHISRATIYNILELFLKAGIIIKHPFPGLESQYETTIRAVSHHHRICTCCGSIKEFTDQKISKAIKNRKFTSYDTNYHAVYLYGICKKCQRQIKNKMKKQ